MKKNEEWYQRALTCICTLDTYSNFQSECNEVTMRGDVDPGKRLMKGTPAQLFMIISASLTNWVLLNNTSSFVWVARLSIFEYLCTTSNTSFVKEPNLLTFLAPRVTITSILSTLQSCRLFCHSPTSLKLHKWTGSLSTQLDAHINNEALFLNAHPFKELIYY